MDNGYLHYIYIYIFKWYDGWFLIVAFVPLAPFRSSGALSTCDLGYLCVCRGCSCPWRGRSVRWSCRHSTGVLSLLLLSQTPLLWMGCHS